MTELLITTAEGEAVPVLGRTQGNNLPFNYFHHEHAAFSTHGPYGVTLLRDEDINRFRLERRILFPLLLSMDIYNFLRHGLRFELIRENNPSHPMLFQIPKVDIWHSSHDVMVMFGKMPRPKIYIETGETQELTIDGRRYIFHHAPYEEIGSIQKYQHTLEVDNRVPFRACTSWRLDRHQHLKISHPTDFDELVYSKAGYAFTEIEGDKFPRDMFPGHALWIPRGTTYSIFNPCQVKAEFFSVIF